MFQATAMIGLAVSFSLSQTGIVISTFGSILLLGEHKTKKEMVYVTVGSLMVIIGGVMLGLLKIMIYKPWCMSGMAFYI